MIFQPFLIAALLLVNLATLFSFWLDKERSKYGGWRIAESSLLGLALIGGSPAALAARRLFRHKTRKEPFSTTLYLICVLQAGAIIGLTFS